MNSFRYDVRPAVGGYIAAGELERDGAIVWRFEKMNPREANSIMVVAKAASPAAALEAARAKEQLGWAWAEREGLL
jgi:hypothetical protein